MNGEKTIDMAYAARCKCGGLVFAAVDSPEHAKDTAKEVSHMIRTGFSIDRIPCDDVRKGPWCENGGRCE